MKIISKIIDLNKAINKISDLGFVPTMGGLHRGHTSLIKISQKSCKKTIVSIFVNPKQFSKKSDFLNYPSNIDKDLNILKKLKVDYVFIPTAKEILVKKKKLKFKINRVDRILCAKYRKGHFEGVLDIMDRLVKLISPKKIFMGEKDFQQFFIVKKFIEANYGSKIYLCKTIRDKNNVALSSRNFFLNKKNLIQAGIISNELIKFKLQIKNKMKEIDQFLNDKKNELEAKFNIKIEYLDVRNIIDLKNTNINKNYKLFIAYYISGVRLIDNF